MGMTTYVEGFRPPDKKWNEMKAVYDACYDARIPVPEAVENFFNGEAPDEAGVRIALKTSTSGAVREWQEDSREGIEVHLDKLPKDIKILRFVNSY